MINYYRGSAGLTPVVDNASWDAGLQSHFEYLRLTPASYMKGQYASAHTENPASPYYTPSGAAAGGSSDLAFGISSDSQAIEGWLTAPLHAIGMLRAQLTKVAFARNSYGYAGLDVIRGLDGSQISAPVLFPGPNSTTSLRTLGPEAPDPSETCAFTNQSSRGLALIAMLPQPVASGTSIQLTRPDGYTYVGPSQDLCMVTAKNWHSSDSVYGPTGQQILTGANAVLIIPRFGLTPGRYVARIVQPGQPIVEWPFYIGGDAGTALEDFGEVRLHVSDTPGETVLGNLTVTGSSGAGWTTLYPCASGRPDASNSNYSAGQTIPNFAAVGTDSNGDICAYVRGSTHLIWDQVGSTASLSATTPVRKRDTRQTTKVDAGQVITVHVTDTASATVFGNLTVLDPEATGWTTAYPCLQGRPDASNNNYVRGLTIANFVAVKADTAGNICLYTSARANLIWDQVAASTAITVGNATRVYDNRATGSTAGGTSVSIHVTDTPNATVLGTLTVTNPRGGGFTTTYPCNEARPNASTNNFSAGETIPNFATVKTDANGNICIYTSATTNLIWDQVSATTALPVQNAQRMFDSRIN